ncbi:phage baseplate upper protein [Lentilactobacillus buchneri]|uniref:phage baseplate upper protein n=1 Tax=Lentilactobacillus buchneri TaxID=1581 RepID=UPI0020BED77A|nr:phage baseplate upper protein [Lentilactobacillus buchneri]
MSKELAFTDDNDVVKYLDTTTAFNLALTADGVAFDLTNAKSILVKIANDDGYIMQQTIDLTTVTSPLGGTLSFPINQNIMNTLVPDDYDIEVWVTMNDGTQAIFPSDGTLGFSIEENLMSDTGEVIPTITLNDFQQQFNDLSSQMENAVHNVQKGDQGNPGNGIKAANNQYQLSDSPVTVPTGGWSDTILATTDQLPYLWTKIIFTYDDGTTKEINFVSSRGDTGSQGPVGPVGPQGKQGNGLVVRGKADKEENLPTTSNNQGDGYLVGTDLYIWIDGSWQNMGSITPDLADYVKVADMNNALNAKQDKIGYTPADDSKVVHGTDTSNWQKQAMFNPGDFKIDVANSTTDFATLLRSKYNKGGIVYIRENDWPVVNAVVICEGSGWWYAYGVNSDGNFVHRRIRASDDTGWIINADDSKVAHLSGANNFDTVPTVNNNPLLLASSLPADLARTSQQTNFTDGLQKGGKDVATTADVTSAISTATANMVDSSKPTNFTAGLQSGGVDVATVNQLSAADDSGWIAFPSNSNLQLNAYYKIFNGVLYTMGTVGPKNSDGSPELMLNVQSIISDKGYNSLPKGIQYHHNYYSHQGGEYSLDFNNYYPGGISADFAEGVNEFIGINLTIPIH